jgi:Lrp/AsnC family leucine-responsive transcriptional regulator
MPIEIDDRDVTILKSLLKDGRKSFRQISRETGITTPTVKARFDRLVNIGFIKSVSPIFDFKKVEYSSSSTDNINKQEFEHMKKSLQQQRQNRQSTKIQDKIKKGILVKLKCDFCKGPILGEPPIMKFANYERFFCCNSCKFDYKKKYGAKIIALTKKYVDSKNNIFP